MKPEKRWSRYVKKCEDAWNKLSFMKQVSSLDAYLTILCMATGLNNLEQLHQLLPDNARLLKDDWLELKEFWKLYFRGDEAAEHRNELIEWLLNEQAGHSGNTSYYIKLVTQRAKPQQEKQFQGAPSPWSARILSCKERSGFGDNHFQTELFGAVVDTGFRLDLTEKYLRVCFVFKERELTEKLTHEIIGNFPDYFILRRGVTLSSTRDGHYLNISFVLEVGELMKCLKLFGNDFVATNEFSFAIADYLRKRSIPVNGDLSPIIGS